MKRLMRSLFPLLYMSYAPEGGPTGDPPPADPPVDPPADPPADPANQPLPDEKVTISKKEFDRLQGTIGNLTQKERDRETAEKKKADEEALKRGEHEKLLKEREEELEAVKPYKERYIGRVKSEHDRLMKGMEDVDEKISAKFKKAEAGQELSLADMEANVDRFNEYSELGLLTSKKKVDEVVLPRIPGAIARQNDNQSQQPGFDPWKD